MWSIISDCNNWWNYWSKKKPFSELKQIKLALLKAINVKLKARPIKITLKVSLVKHRLSYKNLLKVPTFIGIKGAIANTQLKIKNDIFLRGNAIEGANSSGVRKKGNCTILQTYFFKKVKSGISTVTELIEGRIELKKLKIREFFVHKPNSTYGEN